MALPEPRPTALVCSECGQAWGEHLKGRTKPTKARPITAEDCVRVLKAQLAARPRTYWYGLQSGTGISASASVPLYGNQMGNIS